MTDSTQSINKFRDFSLVLLQRHIRLPEEHVNLISDSPASTTLLNRLTDRGLLPEATRLFSYALPEREAIWWACMCVTHTVPIATLPQAQGVALAAAENWVRKPCDETRLQALVATKKAGYDTPAAWAARAAFASRLPASWQTRTGKKVERAIVLAAAYGGTELQPERLRRFIVSGHDIARGGAGRLPPETE